MIERLKLSMVADGHFCALSNETTYFRNKKYRSLLVETWKSGKSEKSINIVQVADPLTLGRLKFKYAEDCHGVAVSAVERCLARLQFGLGDIRPGARHLVMDHEKISLSAGKLAQWLKRNCEGDALLLEGAKQSRVSFDNENDFILARLQFI
jgi:hypothetical protein